MAWPANTGMLLPVALKMRDIRSASLIFQARRGYFWYFSITRSLSQLMFRQRRAQSQVFTTLRQFYPKFSGKWNINGQPWVPRTSSSIGTVAVSTQKKGSSSVPWLTRSLNFAFPALQYRPHPMWLLAVPSSERQTGCSCVQDLSKAIRSELRSIPPKWLSQSLQSWEVFPRSDYHRAFRAEKYSPKVTITKPSLICGDVCNYAHSTRENALKECPTSLNVWSTVSVYKPFVTLFEHLWCRWCDGGHHRLDSSPHQSDEEEERIKIQF